MIAITYPKGEPMLTYGDIPGLNYIMNMPPAVSTAWPDLESYPAEQYKEELAQIKGYPVCVLTQEAESSMRSEAAEDKKLSYLSAFLYNNGYEKIYDQKGFVIYERK